MKRKIFVLLMFDWWKHFDLLCFIPLMLCSCLTVFLLQDRESVKCWTLDFHDDQTLTVSDHKAIKHWPTLTTCHPPRLCRCLFLCLKPADTENICKKTRNICSKNTKHLQKNTQNICHSEHQGTFICFDPTDWNILKHFLYTWMYFTGPTYINRSELINDTTSSLCSLIWLGLPYLVMKMFSVPLLPAFISDFLFLPHRRKYVRGDQTKRRDGRWRCWGFTSLHKIIFNVEQQNKTCRGFAAVNVHLSIRVTTTAACFSFLLSDRSI